MTAKPALWEWVLLVALMLVGAWLATYFGGLAMH